MRDSAPSRDKALDLDSQVGRVTVVQTSAGSRNEVGAFFCDLCDCTLRDNIAYLDHLNGKKHLRMMGFSARTERVTVVEVRAKLASLKRKREEITNYDLDARVKQLQEEEAEAKRQTREARKAKKSDESGDEADGQKKKDDGPEVVAEEVDPELVAMGLPANFGSTK
jgi:U4/U6.U5 tri-snRNP component SNU23